MQMKTFNTHLNQVYHDYIHDAPVPVPVPVSVPVPVPVRESQKPYGRPTSVKLLQLLRKQTNTDTSTAMTAETD